MLEGFYTGASGMLMQQRILNVLGNNIVNTKTPGFRPERVISTTFDQELVRQEAGYKTPIGPGDPSRIVEEVPTTFDPSYLEETGRPFDMAIVGEGFFNIRSTVEEEREAAGENAGRHSTWDAMEGEERIMLTRNGNFDVDSEGFLILRGAGRVQGEGGDIEIGLKSDFTVSADGTVYDSAMKEVDKLLITAPPEGVKLEKLPNGMHAMPEDAEEEAEEAPDFRVVQNAIERSNVDLNREMTLMMEAQRAFQSCANAAKIIDQINQKTATQIASIG